MMPPQISDPFTERLDIISMNHKHQTAKLERIQEKLRHANSQINTFSALNIQRKDEDVAELCQQVDIHKPTIAELRKKQDLTTSVVDNLQACIGQLEGAGTLAGEEDASFAVGWGMNSMRGEMIDMEQRMHAEYTRKEELEGLELGIEKVINDFINSINKQLIDSH
jgi:seryl-tRNA synthetase